jgi:hypothetical protein
MAYTETDAQHIPEDHLYWRDHDWDVHSLKPLRCGCRDEAMPEPHAVGDLHPGDPDPRRA